MRGLFKWNPIQTERKLSQWREAMLKRKFSALFLIGQNEKGDYAIHADMNTDELLKQFEIVLKIVQEMKNTQPTNKIISLNG